ncbi:MAG: hypothetical protein J5506_10800 [Prevotella sp.]|nr:hypothetical protein [Prevotella sp.]
MKKLLMKLGSAALLMLGFSSCIFQPKLYGSPPCLYGPPPEFNDSVNEVVPEEEQSAEGDSTTIGATFKEVKE